jgi:hypothetical protein
MAAEGYEWEVGRGDYIWGDEAGVEDGRTKANAREKRTRRYVLDTAADDQSESESESGSDWEMGKGAGRRLHGQSHGRPGTAGLDADIDEDGYEADFADEDEERQTRRWNGKRQSERQSALCRLEGREDEPRKPHVQHNGQTENKVTAAVRLRKEIKRARRLAGQPSPAMLRRKTSGIQRMGTSMPVPVLHIDGAAV